MGKILFYLLWPLIWLYAPLQRRARVYIVVDGEVLLVRNWFGDGSWQLPGGGVSFRENVEEAARREIFEETGINLIERNLVKISNEPIVHSRAGLIFREWLFIYQLDKKPSIKLSRELTEYKWFNATSDVIPEIVRTVILQFKQ